VTLKFSITPRTQMIDTKTGLPTRDLFQLLAYLNGVAGDLSVLVVEDSITDGVTTLAPSENAVFDALATRDTTIAGLVQDAINDGTTTKAPSQNAVFDALALKAALASPTFTGTPAAPTAAVDTNTTQLATTAMVLAQAAAATPLGNATTAVVGTSTRFARADHVHPGREVLTAARTYYVRTDGSDTNTGLADTSGAAFLTIQKALNVIATIDLAGFTVTIQVGDGTYTAANTIPVTVGQATTASLTIKGNTSTPGNVIISTTSVACFTSQAAARVLIKDMELRTTTSGNCLYVAGVGSEIQFSNIRFGACATNHILVEGGALATCAGNYEITGSAINHFNNDRGTLEVGSKTITLTGTPAFSGQFIRCSQGHSRVFLNTFSGSATGVRYTVQINGTIQTFGAGATALPGNAGGSVATGGQYV
jgi:hypothetical protein